MMRVQVRMSRRARRILIAVAVVVGLLMLLTLIALYNHASA